MMERSVSLCRLNLRHADSEPRSNGAQGSRVKERSSRFQRDCGQAPPKIFISSAGGLGPRPARPATSRSWSTEDFRSEPSPEEGLSSAGLSDSLEDSSQRTDAHSPAGSSAAADSAIGSPDGWGDGDFGAAPEKFSESSWGESGPAWEVYRAVPVQISTLDEGFAPSPEGGPPEEQWCADEGIYSLSSLESAQEQGPSLASEPGEPVSQGEICTSNLSQDAPPAQASGGGGLQMQAGCQQVATTRTSEEQAPEAPEGVKEAAEMGGAVQDHHQETTSPAGNGTAAKDTDPGDEGTGGQEGEEMLEDEGCRKPQGGPSQGLPIEPEDPWDLADPLQESEEALGPSTSAAIPLITVSSEPEEQDPEETREPEGGHPAGLEELHQSEAPRSSGPNPEGPGTLEEAGQPSDPAGTRPVEGPTCPAADEAQSRGTDPEGEPSGGNDLGTLPTAQTTPQRDHGEVRQDYEPPPDSPASPLALGTPLGPEVPGEDRLEDKGGETHSFASGPPARIPHTDLLHAALDESSPTDDLVGDPLEPMDLFYPDKDEAVYSEPPQAEPEAWPSVLSVSALQPAPASRPLDRLVADISSRSGEVGGSPSFLNGVSLKLCSIS